MIPIHVFDNGVYSPEMAEKNRIVQTQHMSRI